MSSINRDSYVKTGTKTVETKRGPISWEVGTVEVTLGRETRRVAATRHGETISAGDLGGRYQTASKVWPATIQSAPLPRYPSIITESAYFGRDDRSGRFNKMNGIFFTGGERV